MKAMRVEHARTEDEFATVGGADAGPVSSLPPAETLAQDLAEESRRTRGAERLKSEFLVNMGHELRTPLNTIIGFAELMFNGKTGPVSDTHREYLGDILTSSHRLLQLINDAVDLAKVESGKLTFRPERVDLTSVAGQVRDVVRGLAAIKHIELEIQLAPTLPEVRLDAGRLKQVIYNYLSNALKFTPESGRVTLRMRPDARGTFRIEVEDTGVGIAPENMHRLFVELQQLGTGSAERCAGTGFGLALTRRIVEAQGGSVGAQSTPAQGSVFWATLPTGLGDGA
jgi:signal transduction histidine kinase